MSAMVADKVPKLFAYDAIHSPTLFSVPTYTKKRAPRTSIVWLFQSIFRCTSPLPPPAGSTIHAGMAAIASATTSDNAATNSKNIEIPRPSAAAATRKGHATAPTLQQKFTVLSAALRRSGFTSATRRFDAGTASPSPAPYPTMQAMPNNFEPASRAPTLTQISTRPALIAKRNPKRDTSKPENPTASVEAQNCMGNNAPACE